MSRFCRFCRTPIDADTCPTCDPDGRIRKSDPPPLPCRQERSPESEPGPDSHQRRQLLCKRAEVLAARIGKAHDKPVFLLAVRIGTLSRRATNVHMTPRQARRLLDDLTQLFTDEELRDAAGPPDHESRIAFDQIMQDESRPTGNRPEEAQ